MTKKAIYIASIALLSIVNLACKKEKTSWDTAVKAPLIETELSIKHLLASDQLVTSNDSSLKLVFENNLIDIDVSEVFSIEDTTVEFGSSLQTLILPDDSTLVNISLGQVGTAGGFGAFLGLLNGATFQIPAMNNIVIPVVPIDNSDLFESVNIETGSMSITVSNGLPVEAVNVQVEVRNTVATGGTIIATTTFPSIPPNTTVSNVISLDGKVVSSQLETEIYPFSTLASPGPVLIDTTDAITAKIKIQEIRPSGATAIWPDQNLIDTTRLYKIPKSEGVLMKDMIVEEGNLEIEVFSSLQDSIYITYSIPNLLQNNNPFIITSVVPPAPANGISSIVRNYSFFGYDFKFNGFGIESTIGEDLNGNSIYDNDTVNAYVQNTKVRIQYTGQMKTLSKSDTVYIKATISAVTPSSASGYLGSDTIKIGPSQIDFSVLEKYVSGKIELDKVKMDISIDNKIGSTAKMKINSLSGTNSINNTTVNLSGAAVSSEHSISAGTKSGNPSKPVNSGTTTIDLNSTNSTINEFIGNLPNHLTYDIQTILNAGIPVPTPPYSSVISSPPNFIYKGQGFNAKLNVEIPLSLIAESLVLVDTINFNYTEDLSEANEAIFTVLAENNFAFDATLHLILMDDIGNELDTLLSNGFIKRGVVDPVSGKTIENTTSKLSFVVSKNKMSSIAASTKIKALIKLHSYNLNDPSKKSQKIYSSDGFKLKLIGSSIYNVNF